MSRREIMDGTVGFAALLLVFVLGCEALHKAGVPGLERYAKVDQEALAEERANRERYSVHRDHKALYWLLSHRVSNGMTLQEVEDLLGDSGEFTTDYKALDNDGVHQSTDSVYKWGPDKTGKSAVIFFRDGHVCNFDPKYYKTP